MNPEEKKTFDNTSSSYLSLKAELLRKKQDIQRASSASISSTAILDNLQATSSSLKLKTKPDLDIEIVNSSKKKKKKEGKLSLQQQQFNRLQIPYKIILVFLMKLPGAVPY